MSANITSVLTYAKVYINAYYVVYVVHMAIVFDL